MSSPKRNSRQRLLRVVLPFAVVLAVVIAYELVWVGRGERLIVYCAHDAVYSRDILKRFEKETGIAVAMNFDTEATKSLGLVEQIIREKDAPRCDVFWNNEILGTIDLGERGLLLPYKGPGFARIPAGCKDPEGHWAGFAARLRVFIVNTEKMSLGPSQVEGAGEAVLRGRLDGDLSRAAIAKPLYGTTLTHYSVLWDSLGPEGLQAWHNDLRKRGIREVGGNATVKNLVASGVCDLGFTDSDDFFGARDEGKPVAMLPVRLADGRTVAIPNTVCIIKGTSRLDAAKRLVDFLLSEEVELALAGSKSRQIPLGPVDESRLSDEVRQLKGWAEKGYPLTSLGEARRTCLSWLKSEYLK